MTILCYKNGEFAADGLEVHGDLITSKNVKKIIVATKEDRWTILGKRIVAFAIAGTPTAEITMKKYMSKGIDMEQQFINVCHDEFSALCIDGEGTSYVIDSIKDDGVFKLIIVDTKPAEFGIAVGIASEVARALMNGKLAYSAKEAVAFSCDSYVSCGGVIQVETLTDIVKRLSV